MALALTEAFLNPAGELLCRLRDTTTLGIFLDHRAVGRRTAGMARRIVAELAAVGEFGTDRPVFGFAADALGVTAGGQGEFLRVGVISGPDLAILVRVGAVDPDEGVMRTVDQVHRGQDQGDQEQTDGQFQRLDTV